ncbi:uncharacterized protein [Asterias amurensis]|uniref:uncharacterized protein n=1 Tax=Asterias amurensis TaxID=7602 RepID=UPI003AB204BE
MESNRPNTGSWKDDIDLMTRTGHFEKRRWLKYKTILVVQQGTKPKIYHNIGRQHADCAFLEDLEPVDQPSSSEKDQEDLVKPVDQPSSSEKDQEDLVKPVDQPSSSEKDQEDLVKPVDQPSSSEKDQDHLKPADQPSSSEKDQEDLVKPVDQPSSSEKDQDHLKPVDQPSSSEKDQDHLKPADQPSSSEKDQEDLVKPVDQPSSSEKDLENLKSGFQSLSLEDSTSQKSSSQQMTEYNLYLNYSPCSKCALRITQFIDDNPNVKFNIQYAKTYSTKTESETGLGRNILSEKKYKHNIILSSMNEFSWKSVIILILDYYKHPLLKNLKEKFQDKPGYEALQIACKDLDITCPHMREESDTYEKVELDEIQAKLLE